MKFWNSVGLMTIAVVLSVISIACNKDKKVSNNGIDSSSFPVFSLASSEYPSWSTFMVAAKAGLINPKEGGKPGTLEEKWGVDIVLHVKDYDPCLTMYSSASVDAVCMTNMDALNPALGRPSTAILPTSTSVGADKVIAVGINKPSELRDIPVFGLSKSVSEYVFVRGLEKNGLASKNYKFNNLEPAAAATALQTGSNGVKAICVWNPFALQTLRTKKEAKVVFDSSIIPEEIIDMVVVSNESLSKNGGDKFACCICDVFYEVNKKLADPKTGDVTFKALGEDFSNLSVEDMKLCCKETRFYSTPQDGMKLFNSSEFPKTMATVLKTCQDIGVLETGKIPTVGYNSKNSQLNFSTEYMQRVIDGK